MVTWFMEHPLVDETKVALWGLCFGGNVTLAAASFEYVTFCKNAIEEALPIASKSLSFDPHGLTPQQQADRRRNLRRPSHRLDRQPRASPTNPRAGHA